MKPPELMDIPSPYSRNIIAFFILVIGIIHASLLHAEIPGVELEKGLHISGYVRYLTGISIPQDGDNISEQLLHNRINIEWQASNQWRAYIGLRNRLFYGERVANLSNKKVLGEDSGHWDLSVNWGGNGDYLLNTGIDRLYIENNKGIWQWRLGRQRINWGMSSLWNPNDLFNTYSIFDFDYEERPGTDSLMLNHYLDATSNIELVLAFGDNPDQSSLALRYRFNYHEYDIQFIAGQRQNDRVLAIGWIGAISEMGWHGEASRFEARGHVPIAIQDNTVITTGIDYTFNNGLMLTADVLYNARPRSFPTLNSFTANTLDASSLSFTRWTSHVSATFDLTPLQKLSLSAAHYNDGSRYISLNDHISLADDWGLFLIAQHFYGDEKSLYGSQAGSLVFARLQWSY